jgi:hypothetical protein
MDFFLFFLHNGTSSWYVLSTGYSDKNSLVVLKADTKFACFACRGKSRSLLKEKGSAFDGGYLHLM